MRYVHEREMKSHTYRRWLLPLRRRVSMTMGVSSGHPGRSRGATWGLGGETRRREETGTPHRGPKCQGARDGAREAP